MNHLHRNLFHSALVLVLGTGLAVAQQTAPAPSDTQTQQAPPPHMRHTPNPEREVKRLAKVLNLTPDQTAKLEPVLANRDQQMEAIRSNGQLTQHDARQQMKALHQSTEQQLAAILTPDQLNQMKQMRRGPHGQHGQWQGGAQSQGAPQPSGL